MSIFFVAFNGLAWALKCYLKSETIVNYKPSSAKEGSVQSVLILAGTHMFLFAIVSRPFVGLF
jgi:hypothetical protein